MTNITLFQFFHWYYSPEGNLWQHITDQAARVASLGISHVWLPPAYKSANGQAEPGYAVYDLFDLGESDQKGTVRTRYGTKQEYLDCIKALHDNGLQVMADIVLNHKLGGDETEKVKAVRVDPQNRSQRISEEEDIEVYTKYYFPGRNRKYSEFVWDHTCFTGIDKAADEIYLLLHEYTQGEWEELVEEEMGNFDYLMGSDIEFRNPHVREELKYWGRWYIEETGVDALRLDAVKHITPKFYNEWIDHINEAFGKKFFCIGEYWRHDPEHLLRYLEATNDRVQLFDVPLHFHFHEASMSDSSYDMSKLLDNTLLQHRPDLAITFVDNHDTQPLQSLQSPVDFWFKPHAYAIILLRQQGIPCVFYPMLYDAKYVDHMDGQEIYVELFPIPYMERQLLCRKLLAYGLQRDYFDHPNTVGWTREGDDEHEGSGCAVLITNGTEGNKRMEVGKRHAGATFIDGYGGCEEKVLIDEEGFGEFFVNERFVSIWVREDSFGKIEKP